MLASDTPREPISNQETESVHTSNTSIDGIPSDVSPVVQVMGRRLQLLQNSRQKKRARRDRGKKRGKRSSLLVLMKRVR